MINVHFLGNGSAFNYEKDNTACYFSFDHHYYFIDMGEKIASKIKSMNLLTKEDKVTIIITHMHADHVGSLEPFLVLLYFIIGIKNITLLCPNKDKMKTFLSIFDFNTSLIKINDASIYQDENIHIESCEAHHISDSRSYFIYSKEGSFYYSGDTSFFNKKALEALNEKKINCIYHEVAWNQSSLHTGIETLTQDIPLEERSKVYLMHFENDELMVESQKRGFNIVIS